MKHEHSLDAEKPQIILACLGKRFHDVRTFRGASGTLFAFHNGKQSWQLKFNREFLEYLHPNENLQLLLECTVIPAILENPDMRIEVGSDGGITIAEKQP